MDTSGTTGAVAAPPKQRSWRRHSDEFKGRVIELARQPGTSMAAVALANGLNANLLRRWVRQSGTAVEARTGGTPQPDTAMPAFVQLPLAGPSVAAASSSPTPMPAATIIAVEIQRNGSSIRASLPLDSRGAAWLREVIR